MNGLDFGTAIGLIKGLGSPDPAVIESAVSDWLDDHPEATTTVQDGSITKAKLDSNLQGTVDDVADLKSEMDVVDNTLGIYPGGNFTATVAKAWTVTPLGTMVFKKGVSYTSTFSIAAAVDYTIYIYIRNLDNDTNILSAQLTAGNITYVHQYVNNETDVNVELRFQTGVSTSTMVSVSVEANGDDKISAITEKLDNVDNRQLQNSARVDDICGNVAIYEDEYEIGGIYIAASGWTYVSTPYNIRSKEGFTLKIKAGDIFRLSDYTNARYYVGWRTEDGTYGLQGWLTSDFTAPVDGEYVIVITTVSGDVPQTDVNMLLSLLSITRVPNISDFIVINNNIRCINHRGFAAEAPENTIPAFQLSKQKGFDYVETDVAFTSDGVPVLMHDDTVDRTTDGTGNIWDLTYARVETLDAGSWFSSKYTGTKVPSLEQFMAFCKKAGLGAYLEIKASHPPTSEQCDTIATIVKKAGMVDGTTFICTNINPLVSMLSRLPTCRGGIITGAHSISDAITYLSGQTTYDMFISTNSITDEQLATCASNGIPVEFWLGSDTDINWANIPVYVTGLTSNIKKLSDYWYVESMD